MKMIRRIALALSVAVLLGAAAAPAWATLPAAPPTQPHIITGSYKTTNPLYPLMGTDPDDCLRLE